MMKQAKALALLYGLLDTTSLEKESRINSTPCLEMGYDNLDRDIYHAVGLKLFSVDQPTDQIGYQSAQSIPEQIQGSESHTKHIKLKPKLLIRTSCGAAPGQMPVGILSQNKILLVSRPERSLRENLKGFMQKPEDLLNRSD